MLTILLIEDHPIIRENTAQLLELASYAVQTAENGELGVQLALATRPDLIICDIMMPVLDGYGVLQIFNQHPQLTGVPFIFLTAKTDQADRRRGMAFGADDYLSKPFEKADLLSAVSSGSAASSSSSQCPTCAQNACMCFWTRRSWPATWPASRWTAKPT
ncbi:response regulator [Hymenobacter sp. UV11]|uniref:response regulator transcription factor n=1 Tax=Hymenobacter sp. UV11 TaxID=1849735 RepID=UPI002939325D|nr:response regulator [Hymenobacter sp. UV11]